MIKLFGKNKTAEIYLDDIDQEIDLAVTIKRMQKYNQKGSIVIKAKKVIADSSKTDLELTIVPSTIKHILMEER